MRYARIYPWRRTRRSRAPSNRPEAFFVAQFSAGYTTDMFGFDLRQGQSRSPRYRLVNDLVNFGALALWHDRRIGLAVVQYPHDADARKHRRAARRRNQDQRFHCGLPLRGLMLGLRKFRDVGAGVLESDELAAARQRYRIVKPAFPPAVSQGCRRDRAGASSCAYLHSRSYLETADSNSD